VTSDSIAVPKAGANKAWQKRTSLSGRVRNTRRGLSSLAFCVVLAYGALLLLPTFVQPILPGSALDEAFALNHFIHTQFKFGPDLIFTYGPMGYVPAPMPGNLGVALAIKVSLWLVLLWQLAAMWRSGRHFASTVLVLGLIAANKVFFYYWDYLVAATILIVLVRMLLGQIEYSGLVLLAILTGFIFLVKFTAFVLSIACVTLYSAGVRRNKWGWRRIALTKAIFLAGPVAYLIYNPSIRGLFLYIKGAFNIVSGYAAAASLPTNALNIKLAIILCTLLGGSALYALSRRLVTLRGVAIVTFAFWVVFRHGYVRSHPQYEAVFCSFAIFLFAVLLAQMDPRPLDRGILSAVFVLFTVVAMHGAAERWQPQALAYWSPRIKGTPLDLLHWKQAVENLDHRDDPLFDATLGHTYQAELQGKRALVFPLISYPVHDEFEVVPLYTIMAYDAYTPYLDRMSANRILAGTPPLDHIIFEWQSSDNRHPLLDVPVVWNTLFANFVPEIRKDDSLLLVRRPVPLQFVYTPMSTAEYRAGTWVSLPVAKKPVAMSIDLRPTIFGAVLKAAYKQEPVFADMRTLSGNTMRFRLPVDVLADPALINVLPLSFDDTASLWAGNIVEDPVVAFRLVGEGLAHLRPAPYRFYSVDGTSIAVSDQSPAALSGPSRNTLQARFYISSTAEIHNVLAGYLDSVDSKPVPGFNDPKMAVRVSVPVGCIVEGWLTSGDSTSPRAMDEVYALVNGSLIKAQIVPRGDIQDHFKNPALLNSGFRIYLDGRVLHPGLQGLELIGYTRDDGQLYRFPATLFLEGE